MNGQKHKERNDKSKETAAGEEESHKVGSTAVQAVRRASDQISEIEAVIEDNEADNAKIAQLMKEIDEIFGQENPEALVKDFVQKGGQ